MLNKVGREFQPDFQANINLNLWFNFQKIPIGDGKVDENSVCRSCASYVEVQLEI